MVYRIAIYTFLDDVFKSVDLDMFRAISNDVYTHVILTRNRISPGINLTEGLMFSIAKVSPKSSRFK